MRKWTRAGIKQKLQASSKGGCESGQENFGFGLKKACLEVALNTRQQKRRREASSGECRLNEGKDDVCQESGRTH